MGGEGPCGGAGRAGGVSGPAHARLPHPPPQRAQCERLLTASAFASCQGLVPVELYVQACTQDRCQCPQNASCVCSTIAEFSRQCSHAGGRPENWRTNAFCRKRRAGTAAGGRRGLTGDHPGERAGLCGCPAGRPGVSRAGSHVRSLDPSRCPPRPPLGSGVCLCLSSQELPWEHGLPGEWLALHGHLLTPGGQQPL